MGNPSNIPVPVGRTPRPLNNMKADQASAVCRSGYDTATDAIVLGASKGAVPPVLGAVWAGVNGGMQVAQDIKNGQPGAAAGAALTTIPAVAAGFVAGGLASDVVQGAANTVAQGMGANGSTLPHSSAQALIADAACHIAQAKVPTQRTTQPTSPAAPSGQRGNIPPANRAPVPRVQTHMGGLY